MLKEFIDFVDSVLPSVSPDFRDGAKEAITQFEKEGQQIKYLTLTPLEKFSQGDIISSVPFCFFDKDGELKQFNSDALVLSTSCHIDQRERLVLVPVLPLKLFRGKNHVELKRNKVYDYMYIPDGTLIDKFVNFEIMNTYSRDLIMSGIKKGKIKRVASLNQIGYYFLIIKLTVYLMRKEDTDTLDERNDAFVN